MTCWKIYRITLSRWDGGALSQQPIAWFCTRREAETWARDNPSIATDSTDVALVLLPKTMRGMVDWLNFHFTDEPRLS